jgi:predicted metalloprotease with PDZ domain
MSHRISRLALALSLALPALASAARCAKPLDACIAEKEVLYQTRGVLGFGWSLDDDRIGVCVVAPGYPAAAAGLQVGDVLLELDGKSLAEPSQETMDAIVGTIKIGQLVPLRVRRGEQELSLTITAGKPDANFIHAWIVRHLRAEHDPADLREYLRRLETASPSPPRL